jgi:hypothetical protein
MVLSKSAATLPIENATGGDGADPHTVTNKKNHILGVTGCICVFEPLLHSPIQALVVIANDARMIPARRARGKKD